jgi:UDP:flavonoid glycosyltransferase YjiC (YdhE family)
MEFMEVMNMGKRVLFAVHDWGLGHATRSLLLIRALVARGDEVTVLSAAGPGMQLLHAELGDTCEFHPYRDIPKPFSRYPVLFYVRMSLDTPLVLARFKLEHRLTERLVREHRFDLVVSDSRFGVFSRQVPSYCILHSLRQIIPGRLHWMERLVEWGQRGLLEGFRKILIPDVEEDGGLSGDLGHDPALDWGPGRLVYIGPLSSIRRQDGPEYIDCFFSVSGIEPQLSLLARKVLDALPHMPGRIVVALGRPSAAGNARTMGNATVYDYLDRKAQGEMLNRARVVMTRSGYTTLMELAELGKRALFVPTPGQSEQEYLARFHHRRGHVFATTQRELDIPRDVVRAAATAGMPRITSADSVRRFLTALD